MALLELGRFVDAQSSFESWLGLAPEGHPLHSAALQRRLYCDELIALDRRLPAVLRGEDAPVDGPEYLSFADLCVRKNHHAAAARFFAEAFSLVPEAFEDAPPPPLAREWS